MKHEGLDAAARRLGLTLDRSQIERLERFEALLRERGATLGLVSEADITRLRERHILDTLRVALAVRPRDLRAYDLGSGGGLPGVPVAIACPSLEVALVEVRRRKAAFLELVVEELGLPNAEVLARSVEELTDPVDLCFSRAFADASASWRAASRVLALGGRLVYFAGARFDAARDAPPGVHLELLEAGALARAGSLAIMSRQ